MQESAATSWLILLALIVGNLSVSDAQWAAFVDGRGNDLVNAVAIDINEDIFILSTFDNMAWLATSTGMKSPIGLNCPRDATQCAFVSKLSKNGTFIWRAYVSDDDRQSIRGLDVTTDTQGNVVATIVYETTALMVYDANGVQCSFLRNSLLNGFAPYIISAASALVKWSGNGSFAWAIRFDGDNDDSLRAVATDSQGSVYVGGMTDSWDIEIFDRIGLVRTIETACEEGPCGAVLKYTSDGQLHWYYLLTDLYGGRYVNDLELDSSGNVILCGHATDGSAIDFVDSSNALRSRLPNTGYGLAGFIASISSSGAFNWAARLRNTQPLSLSIGSDSAFVVAGMISGGNAILYDRSLAQVATIQKEGTTAVFLAKYTGTGSFLWSARMTGSTTSSSETAFAVAVDTQNNVLVGGEFFSVPLNIYDASNLKSATMRPVGSSGAFLVKFTSSGSLLWTSRIDSPGRDLILGLSSDPSNSILVAAVYNGDAFLFDAVGNPSLSMISSSSLSSGVMLKMSSDGVWPYVPLASQSTTGTVSFVTGIQTVTSSTLPTDESASSGAEASGLEVVDIIVISVVGGCIAIASFTIVFILIRRTQPTPKPLKYSGSELSLLSSPLTKGRQSSQSQILSDSGKTNSVDQSTKTHVATTHELSIPAFLERRWGIDFREGAVLAIGGVGTLFTCVSLNPEWKEVRNQSIVVKKAGNNLESLNMLQRRQFFQELSLMWKFRDNPNFCRVFGFSIAPVGLVLKFYELGDLSHYIEGKGLASHNFKFTKFIIVRISREFISAIKTLHDQGIAHCDIKTSNILLDRDPFGQLIPVITDFGISQIVLKDMQVKAFEKSDINGLSFAYAAPEILRRALEGAHATDEYFFKRADIFSSAMTLYALCSRREPWQ